MLHMENHFDFLDIASFAIMPTGEPNLGLPWALYTAGPTLGPLYTAGPERGAGRF